jgi:RimJ/RimL family protein N-acetyltransferase
LAHRLWGRGLATEIANVLVDWHRAHPMNEPGTLTAFATTDNVASRRVLEKVGFRLQRIQPHDGRAHAFYELEPWRGAR